MVEEGRTGTKPRRGLQIGMAIAGVLAIAILAFFAVHVARPLTHEKPNQAALPTQR